MNLSKQVPVDFIVVNEIVFGAEIADLYEGAANVLKWVG